MFHDTAIVLIPEMHNC